MRCIIGVNFGGGSDDRSCVVSTIHDLEKNIRETLHDVGDTKASCRLTLIRGERTTTKCFVKRNREALVKNMLKWSKKYLA